MAEFCLECHNKMNQMNLSEEDVILSDDLELCEGCGEIKNVVISIGYHNSFDPLDGLFYELYRIITRSLHCLVDLCKRFTRKR